MILERKDTLSIRPAFPLKTLFENILGTKQNVKPIDFIFKLMIIKEFLSYIVSFLY